MQNLGSFLKRPYRIDVSSSCPSERSDFVGLVNPIPSWALVAVAGRWDELVWYAVDGCDADALVGAEYCLGANMAKSGQANDSSGSRAGRLRLIGTALFSSTLSGGSSRQVERGIRRKMRRRSTHNLGSLILSQPHVPSGFDSHSAPAGGTSEGSGEETGTGTGQ
jgi:hypothetical protein